MRFHRSGCLSRLITNTGRAGTGDTTGGGEIVGGALGCATGAIGGGEILGGATGGAETWIGGGGAEYGRGSGGEKCAARGALAISCAFSLFCFLFESFCFRGKAKQFDFCFIFSRHKRQTTRRTANARQ